MGHQPGRQAIPDDEGSRRRNSPQNQYRGELARRAEATRSGEIVICAEFAGRARLLSKSGVTTHYLPLSLEFMAINSQYGHLIGNFKISGGNQALEAAIYILAQFLRSGLIGSQRIFHLSQYGHNRGIGAMVRKSLANVLKPVQSQGTLNTSCRRGVLLRAVNSLQNGEETTLSALALIGHNLPIDDRGPGNARPFTNSEKPVGWSSRPIPT